MKKIYRILFGIHIFVGVGALAGGLMAILNPQSPGGMSVDQLKNSPFTTYLIPGLILFAIIGIGNIMSAISMHFKSRYQGYISCIFSLALVFWIIIQCIMIQAIVHLHVIFFIIGIIQTFLSVLIIINQRLFPVNFFLKQLNILHSKYSDNIIFATLISLEEKISNL